MTDEASVLGAYDAYTEGYDAFEEGAKPDCPYPAGSPDAVDWKDGWAAAEEDAERP